MTSKQEFINIEEFITYFIIPRIKQMINDNELTEVQFNSIKNLLENTVKDIDLNNLISEFKISQQSTTSQSTLPVTTIPVTQPQLTSLVTTIPVTTSPVTTIPVTTSPITTSPVTDITEAVKEANTEHITQMIHALSVLKNKN